MSFRVNTNVTAMSALRNVSNTTMELSGSTTRLSTGLRINSAGDDPAGLIMSEKFRAQIAGLEQAVRNNQDAINYAKTAEGALEEVNRLLKDARALSIASANSAVTDSSQLAANQSQIVSIVDSINRIATNTQFGSKKLLNGSAGTTGSVTDTNYATSIYLSGNFNAAALTTNSTVTMQVTAAATRANITSTVTYASTATTINTASNFTVNGISFNVDAGTTVGQLINKLNASSDQTGVQANFVGNSVVFSSSNYGADSRVTLTDAQGRFTAAGTTNVVGTNGVASVTINGAAVIFTSGISGNSGLSFIDADNNRINISEAGNSTAGATAIGQAFAGTAQFQIGGNQNQTANLSLGNMAAAQLGQGAVSGLNLSNMDLTTSAGANNSLAVIDKAIEDVSRERGKIGNFQRNVLESNIRSLGVAKEAQAATESNIRDTDVAEEMSRYTKLQILQQAGLSVLAQANSAPQSVLSLLQQ